MSDWAIFPVLLHTVKTVETRAAEENGSALTPLTSSKIDTTRPNSELSMALAAPIFAFCILHFAFCKTGVFCFPLK